MSPTLLRQDGYQFVVFPNDHPPAHVHVRRAGKVARIQLDPVELMDNYGYNSREISKILQIVQDNQGIFWAGWDSFRPGR